MGVPVGAGTDATRVASYNPWVSPVLARQPARRSAARRSTRRRTGSTGRKPCGATPSAARGSPARRTRRGPSKSGKLADLAVLSADYFSVPEEEIKRHRVGADGRRRQGGVRRRATSPKLAPPPLPVSPTGRRSRRTAATTRPGPRRPGPAPGHYCSPTARHGKHGTAVGPGLRVLCVLSRHDPQPTASASGGHETGTSHVVGRARTRHRAGGVGPPPTSRRPSRRRPSTHRTRSRSRCGWRGRTRPTCRCRSSATSSTPPRGPGG